MSANFYPVEFCQHLPNKPKDNGGFSWAYANCVNKVWSGNDYTACHGAEQGYVFGQNHDTDAFGRAVSEAYGHFFRDGFIPADKDFSLNNLHGM